MSEPRKSPPEKEMILMGNVYFRDITVRPVYEDRRYYEGLLNRDDLAWILNQIIPSTRVREHILNEGTYRRKLQQMIWHSSAPLKVKAEIMHFLTEREEGNLDIRYKDTGIERDSLTSVRRRMACGMKALSGIAMDGIWGTPMCIPGYPRYIA